MSLNMSSAVFSVASSLNGCAIASGSYDRTIRIWDSLSGECKKILTGDKPVWCVCVGCLFLRTPSRAPYRTPPACANRAAYPDPPPVVPHPESIDTRASYRGRHSTIARCVCFITAGPITKLCVWGEEESGGHVL